MSQVKNVKTRCLAIVLTVCMLISAFSTLASAITIQPPVDEWDIGTTKYDVTVNYVDETGAQIADSETKTDAVTGAGNTYDEPAKNDIDGYTYIGFYVVNVGDLNNLTEGNLFVQTQSDGTDSTEGRGAYTLVAVYSVDKNDNKIPDKNENYDVTEKFVDQDGNSLAVDNAVAVKGGVEYYGTPKEITGYEYVGYYYQGTYTSDAVNLADGSGSLASPIASDPYVLLRSEKGYGTYDVTLVYQKSADWVTVTFDANKGTGTMNPQSVISGVATQLDKNEFTRQGYSFEGWSTDASATTPEYLDEASITTDTNVTLYAVWIPDLSQWSTITFHKNDGSGVDDTYDQPVITGISQTLELNRFENPGFVFKGWSTSENSSTVSYNDGDEITVTGNTDLYAVWEHDDGQWSTIKYHSNTAADETKSELVLTNYTTTLKANTFKNAGYEFVGWSTDGSDTVAYLDEASVMVTGNMDLYAVWKQDDSQWTKVIYHINDESGVDDTREQPVIIGIDQVLNANEFDRPGFDFKGWSTSASSSTISYTDGDTINVTSETHLYAVWEKNLEKWATITFYSNPKDGADETDTQEVVKGQATPLKNNPFTYAGYSFVGWGLTRTADPVDYAQNALVVANEDMSLYAIWTEDSTQRATITYHINDKSGVDTTNTQTVVKDVATPLTANSFKNPGYAFKGWSESATGTVKYADGETVTINSDLHLYAVWEEDDSQWSTITFHINDGSGTDSTYTQRVITGISQTLKENTFKNPGYNFTGWSTSAGTATPNYLDGASITVYGNTDLYAQWTYDRDQWVTVTYHINDDSGVDDTYTQTILKGIDQKLTANKFTNTGYLFAGWSTSATGSASIANEAVVNVSTDTDLYATWTKDSEQWVKIIYDANNGTGEQIVKEVLKGTLTNLDANTFSYAGYSFVGWSYDANSDTIKHANGAYIIPTGDMILYAVWKVDLSQWATITYHINNGTTGNFTTYTQSVIKGVTDTLDPNQFSYYGYKLKGWSTDGSNTVAYKDGAAITINDDLDLYAVWEINEEDWATITFDANGGTGKMDPIKVLKGTTVILSENEYTLTDNIFCGWSIDGDNVKLSDIVYTDKDVIRSLDENTTLYAVWGTPLAGVTNPTTDKDLTINTTANWTGTVYVREGYNSTPMYNTTVSFELPEDMVTVVENSVKVTSNTGSVVLSAYTYENGILTIYLGQINPGTTYTYSFQTYIKVDNAKLSMQATLNGYEYQ